MGVKKKKPELQFLHMDVTVKCNLHCKYCFYGEYNNNEHIALEVKYERLVQIIDEAVEMGCQKIIFSGGEVYTNREKFENLVYYCDKKGLKVLFITNATLINNKDIEFLKSVQECIDEIKISYDGKNQDLTRGGGSCIKTESGIQLIKDSGLPWTINTILTKYNIDDLFDMYEWIKRSNPRYWRIDLPFNLGNYRENGYEIGIENLENTFQILSKMLKRYLNEKPQFGLWMFEIYRPGLEDFDVVCQDITMHPCTYNKRNLGIRGNGEVTPCSRFLDFPLGNIKEQSIRSVKNSEEFKRFWDIKIGDIVECQDCRYLNLCGSGCRANAVSEGGTIYSRDPMACERMKLFEKYIIPLFSKETQECMYGLMK